VINNINTSWNVIETAPHDKEILVYTELGNFHVVYHVENVATGETAWMVAQFDDGDQALLTNATHWMELPKRPSIEIYN
jgi:hypothetical protein